MFLCRYLPNADGNGCCFCTVIITLHVFNANFRDNECGRETKIFLKTRSTGDVSLCLCSTKLVRDKTVHFFQRPYSERVLNYKRLLTNVKKNFYSILQFLFYWFYFEFNTRSVIDYPSLHP